MASGGAAVKNLLNVSHTNLTSLAFTSFLYLDQLASSLNASFFSPSSIWSACPISTLCCAIAYATGYMTIVGASLGRGLGLLLPLAIACTVYLYLYPAFNGCAFPVESRNSKEAFEATKRLHWPYAHADVANLTSDLPTQLAPFRLLTLGDPQLEGDTSIPIAIVGFVPHLRSIFRHVTFQTTHYSLRERIRVILHDLVDFFMEDIPFIFLSIHKKFDLFGNDFYLAHIYRTMHWWTQPTHVTVLGDLIGSQWIEDDEFDKRGRRFWNRTFRGGERLPDELALYPSREYNLSGLLDGSAEEEVWSRRILNIAGNHDIGYAGDLTEERLQRFERVYGKANYQLHFELPITDPEVNATILDMETNPDSRRLQPEIRLIVLNDMNLDTPAKDPALQDATYKFINDAIGTAVPVEYQGVFTIVLTHIPMYKPKGVCVDAPFFDFHAAKDGGGVKEQYLLSADASQGFLEGIFGVNADTNAPGNGRGRPGLVLNGHDHAGCDTFHFINQTNGTDSWERHWERVTWKEAQSRSIAGRNGHPGRREITVRSMMGDFNGNAGLLSMWFDQEAWEWRYEYADCPLGRQHFWWLTHFLDFGVVLCALLYWAVSVLDGAGVDVDARFFKAMVWTRVRANEILESFFERIHRSEAKDACKASLEKRPKISSRGGSAKLNGSFKSS